MSGAIDGVLSMLVADAAGIVVVVDTGEAAPNPSDTWAFDCKATDDVGGVV